MTRVHHVWTDGNGKVGLSWDMLKKLFGTRVHTAHEGNGMFSVHIVHYIEVAHFIIGGGPARKKKVWLQCRRVQTDQMVENHQKESMEIRKMFTESQDDS